MALRGEQDLLPVWEGPILELAMTASGDFSRDESRRVRVQYTIDRCGSLEAGGTSYTPAAASNDLNDREHRL